MRRNKYTSKLCIKLLSSNREIQQKMNPQVFIPTAYWMMFLPACLSCSFLLIHLVLLHFDISLGSDLMQTYLFT